VSPTSQTSCSEGKTARLASKELILWLGADVHPCPLSNCRILYGSTPCGHIRNSFISSPRIADALLQGTPRQARVCSGALWRRCERAPYSGNCGPKNAGGVRSFRRPKIGAQACSPSRSNVWSACTGTRSGAIRRRCGGSLSAGASPSPMRIAYVCRARTDGWRYRLGRHADRYCAADSLQAASAVRSDARC
jgi:hypothetical protein